MEVADSGTRVVLGRILIPIVEIGANNPFDGYYTIDYRFTTPSADIIIDKRQVPIISVAGERKIGDVHVSLWVIPFPSPGTNNNNLNPSRTITSRSPSPENSFQHYERLAQTDAQLPLYPVPSYKPATSPSPSRRPREQSPSPLFANVIGAPATQPYLPIPLKPTSDLERKTNDSGNIHSNSDEASDNVLSELLQRGLKLRDAMANSAALGSSLALSSSPALHFSSNGDGKLEKDRLSRVTGFYYCEYAFT